MKFSRKALLAYAEEGKDKRIDGMSIVSYFVFISLSGFFSIFQKYCLPFSIIITVISVLSFVLTTLILLGKHGLTDGYNFLWTSISSLILSFDLLVLSSYLLYSITAQIFYVVISVITYIICAILFYCLIIFRLSKLEMNGTDKKKKTVSTAYALPSVVPIVLAIRKFMLSNPQYNNIFTLLTYIVIFVGSVLLIMATGIVVKYIILKKLS